MRRASIEVLAAATIVLGLATSSVLAAADPLRTTVLVLPWIVLALVWVHRWGIAHGARALPGNLRLAQALAGLAMLVLTLGRGALGLPLSATVLAAAWALLLAHRVYYQALALRPLLGDRLPRRPSSLFFWLPLIVYLALAPWTSGQRQPDGDEPYYLLLTHSLAYDLDVDLSNDYEQEHWRGYITRPLEPQTGDPVGQEGELYSRHNELLPLALAPAYRLAGKSGALAMMAALTALLAWLVLRLSAAYFPAEPGAALAAWGIFAFAPPLLLYSTQVWAEVPAALLAMIALDRVLTLRERRLSNAELLWGLALPLALLPLLKIRFMLVAVPLAFLAWRNGRDRRGRLLPLAVLLAFFAAAMLWLNQLRFGNPLKIHSLDELALYRRGLADYLEGGLGLFFDPAFGLFGAAPIWLLVLPALFWLVRHRQPLGRDVALITLPYLLTVAPRSEWYGGWSPPFRYGLFMLPLLALALVPLLARRRAAGARMLLAALGLATLALTLLWTAIPGWTYDFAAGSTHLIDHLARATGGDVIRIFPSSVRPRLATWLWPPLATLAVCLLWWLPRRVSTKLAQARALGVSLLLAGLAALPLLAAHLPTRVIEVEDAHIGHLGGHPHPQRWTVDRTRFSGSWMLRPGESLIAPVVPGGKRLEIELAAQAIRNLEGSLELRLAAGEHTLATWKPEHDRRWANISLGPFEWSAGDSLTLEVRGARAPAGQPPNGLVIDRLDLRWLSAKTKSTETKSAP